MGTPEGKVKIKVMQALGELNAYRFMPVPQGYQAATLDYLCCIDGMFVAIETKAPGAKLTPRQAFVAAIIADKGGLVFVVRDDDDIRRLIIMVKLKRTGVIFDTLGSKKMYGENWCLQ